MLFQRMNRRNKIEKAHKIAVCLDSGRNTRINAGCNGIRRKQGTKDKGHH